MQDIRIPPLGMNTLEVDVVECRVKEGDKVEIGTVLIVVQTEKADVEIESDIEGTVVKVFVEQGQSLKVGDMLCQIEET